MSSIEKLVLIQETISSDKKAKQSESLGRTDHTVFLSVKNAAGFSADIKIQHSPNSTKEVEGDWFDLHDFGTVTADEATKIDISESVLPSVRALIENVSGTADVEMSLFADRRGK